MGAPARWILAALVLAGLTLRLWSFGFGLPGVYNVDETPILNRALAFAKGDPNPHNFLYPTLHFYLLFAWQGLYFAFGWLAGWFESAAAFEQRYFVDPSGHVAAGRVLTALLGAATIGATFWLGRRLYGVAVGLGAALFMAVSPLAVRDAHYIKLDLPVAFFATLAHAAVAGLVVDRERAARRRSWLIAGVLAGFAISAHYYGAFLAFLFVGAWIADVQRSGSWRRSLPLLLWAGAGTLAGFVMTSPFFFLEPAAVVRDLRELREVNIDRAVRVGLFSSAGEYATLLARSLGYPVAALALAGSILALVRDWRRGLVLTGSAAAFLVFLANTYPSSRYLNILLPPLTVAAAYAVARISSRFGRSAPAVAALVCLAAAVPSAVESVRWDRFLAMDDTRTQARLFVEHEVPAGSTVLLQPSSAPIRQSSEGLREALRAKLGDERKASVKHRMQLAAPPAHPSYRVLYLGDSGKTDTPPPDVDKIYISLRAASRPDGLAVLRAAGVQYVLLTRDGRLPPAFLELSRILTRSGTRLATFSPYTRNVNPDAPPGPVFKHNTNSWLQSYVERPGPVVEVWRLD
jgi:hypothetical protein